MCEGGGYRDFVVRIEEGRKGGRGEDSCVHSVCKVYILVTAKLKRSLYMSQRPMGDRTLPLFNLNSRTTW